MAAAPIDILAAPFPNRRESGGTRRRLPLVQSVQKPRGHPANKAYSATPMPPLAIPAQAGIQRIKRALRAPSVRSEGAADSHKLAPPPAGGIVRMCAFRAVFALDSRLRGNGGYLPCQWVVFRAILDFRSFCTACCGTCARGRPALFMTSRFELATTPEFSRRTIPESRRQRCPVQMSRTDDQNLGRGHRFAISFTLPNSDSHNRTISKSQLLASRSASSRE